MILTLRERERGWGGKGEMGMRCGELVDGGGGMERVGGC